MIDPKSFVQTASANANTILNVMSTTSTLFCAYHTHIVLDADRAYDRARVHPPDPAALYEALGDLIRRKRKQVPLTQKELSARLGVSRASIANIETGRQKILVHQLLQLAAVLEIPAENLLAAAAGEPAHEDVGDLPLPNHLSSKQKSQISRLFGNKKTKTSLDESKG